MASENIINRFGKNYDWNTSTNKVDNTKEVEAQKENIVKLPIKEVIDKFIKGNMTLEALAVWCNGNNCEVTTATQSSTAYTISFKFQGKTYKVVSNIEAAKSSTDDITTLTFKKEDLLNKYKLNQDAISTYFSEVANIDGGEKQYAFKSSYASKFADINDFLTYYNTRNNLIMYNYANNNITDKNGDATAKALYTNTINKTLSTSNYTKYVDKVDDLVADETKLTKQVLDKFVSEFSAGKVDYDQITTILDAANIKDVHKTTLANGKVNFEFTFDGKTYKINTNSETESSAINTALKSVTNKTTTTKSDGTKTVTTTNADGTKLTQVFDANGKLTKETFYGTNGKQELVKAYTNGVIKSETFYKTDGKTKTGIKSYTDGKLSSETTYEYDENNVKTKATVKDAKGKLKSETFYNDNGKQELVKAYTDGVIKSETFYKADGKTKTSVKSYTDGKFTQETLYEYNSNNVKTKATVKDAKGKLKSETFYDDAGTKTSLKSYTDGVLAKVTSYTKTGKTSCVKTYKNGKVTTEQIYEYDSNGNKTKYVKKSYDTSGKLTTKVTTNYNTDGSYTQFTYKASTGAVTRKDVDKDGKNVTVSGKSRIKGKGKISKSVLGISITRTTEQMYNYITQNLNKTFASKWIFSISVREAMNTMTGPLTVALLEAAQIGKGKPAGASKTYNSVAETGLSEDIQEFIIKTLKNTVGKNYGYDPEDVKGYFFDSNSSQAKAIAGSSELKNILNDATKLKKIVDKSGLPMGMSLTSTADLANSISGCYIIDSDLSGKTLTLKIFDIYDFDPKYVDNLKKDTTSVGGVMNAAGAAAMMDGKLKPYYHITEVKVTLTPAQLNSIK